MPLGQRPKSVMHLFFKMQLAAAAKFETYATGSSTVFNALLLLVISLFAAPPSASALMAGKARELMPERPGYYLDYTCRTGPLTHLAVNHLAPELQLISTGSPRPEKRAVLLSSGNVIELTATGAAAGTSYYIDASGNQQVTVQIIEYGGTEFSAVVRVGRYAGTEYFCQRGIGR